ncbi:MAG: AbrB/MazE/SpoVT family DNA-binding domain-containing protein [Planctomycetes bacterium]|jgi:antitoxin component of MazEF toxin-antitoxin module|nr:AbrB/MazE/SpoVT family DNA-binding domain-containing protein [Planctomycetota bacterium]
MAYESITRKIQKNGRGSYYINIPKEILRDLKWQEKQGVTVAAQGGALIITNHKKARG